PLNVAAFLQIPQTRRAAAVGLLALLRNEGGSVGTTLAHTMMDRREQFHTLRLNEHLDPLNPAVTDFLQRGQSLLMPQTGDPVLSRQITLAALEHARDRQASSLAYFDIFFACAALALVLVLLVLLMRRAVAEKGA